MTVLISVRINRNLFKRNDWLLFFLFNIKHLKNQSVEKIIRTERWAGKQVFINLLASTLFVLVSTSTVYHQNVLDLFLWKYLNHKKLQNPVACIAIHGMCFFFFLPSPSSLCLTQCDLIVIWEFKYKDRTSVSRQEWHIYIFFVHMGIKMMKYDFPTDCCSKALRSAKWGVSQSFVCSKPYIPTLLIFLCYGPQSFPKPILMWTARFPAFWSMYWQIMMLVGSV